jgi:hypothetical protein
MSMSDSCNIYKKAEACIIVTSRHAGPTQHKPKPSQSGALAFLADVHEQSTYILLSTSAVCVDGSITATCSTRIFFASFDDTVKKK